MNDILVRLGLEPNSQFEFRREDVDLILCGLLFFDPTGGNPNPILSLLRYMIVCYLLLRYIRDIVFLPLPSALLIAFSAVLGCTTYFNTGSISQACAGVRFGVQILSTYLVLIHAVKIEGISRTLIIISMVFSVALVVNDVLMVALPYNHNDASVLYLLGNKFIVSYGHALLFCLLMTITSARPSFALCVGALCAVMSYITGSMTGFAVVVIVVLLSLAPVALRSRLGNPFAIVVVIALVNVLVWGPANIFSNPVVQSFIVNVLKKSPNMTGRIPIYNITMQFVSQKPLFGWGFQTDIYREVFGFGNAQNGVFHMLTQCGTVGTILYFSGILLLLMKSNSGSSHCYYLYAFLLAMGIASGVEITLGFQFAFCVSLICAIGLGSSHEIYTPRHFSEKARKTYPLVKRGHHECSQCVSD